MNFIHFIQKVNLAGNVAFFAGTFVDAAAFLLRYSNTCTCRHLLHILFDDSNLRNCSFIMELFSETMSLQHNDNDSMMALEALLNIKRDNVTNSACMVHPSQDEPRVMLTPEHRLAVPNPLAVGSMAMPSRQELNRHGFSTSEEVRRSKIESALRSKPQRGRKRDDLSEEERMELTRTRNREHAKSTRYVPLRSI